MADPFGFNNPDKYADLTRYSFSNAGFTTGNPMLDMSLMMMTGQSMTPRPAPGTTQSVMDAYISRERSLQFMRARNQGMANNLFFQKMGGVNPDSAMFQMAGAFLGDPDGIASRMMAPLVGGNPIRAQMGLFGRLSGQTMGAFGRTGNVSLDETNKMMDNLFKGFYTQTPITTADAARGREDAIKASLRITEDKRLQEQFSKAIGSEGAFKDFSLSMSNIKGGSKRLSQIMGENQPDMKEAGEKFIQSITDPTAKRKLTEAWTDALSRGEDGKKSIENLSNEASKLVEKGEASRQLDRMAAKGETRPSAINFAATMGFKIEDITEGFSTAADVRLMGKRGLGENFKRFLNADAKGNVINPTALGVMDAARGLFGNDKGGKELMEEVSSLLGKNFYDLGDPSSAGKLEDLLRQVKGAARVAGISVESILGIIEQGKAFARMHPELQFVGGADVGKIAIRTSTMATALGAYFGNDYVRSQGGMTGLTANLLGGELQAMKEPITQGTAALAALMHDRGRTDIEKFIGNWATGGSTGLGHTRTGYVEMINRVSQMSGENPNFLRAFATNSKGATARGLQLNPDLTKVAFLSAQDELSRYLRLHDRVVGPGGIKASDAFRAAMSGQSIDVDAFLNSGMHYNAITDSLASQGAAGKDQLQVYLNSMGIGRGDRRLARFAQADPSSFDPNKFSTTFGFAGKRANEFVEMASKNGYLNDLIFRNNPELRKTFESQQVKIQADAAFEKEMSRKLGFLNSDMTTTVFNQLLNGNVDRNGLEAFLNPFKAKMPVETFGKFRALGQSMMDLSLAASPADFTRYVTNNGFSVKNEESTNNLFKTMMNSGLTAEQMRSFGGEDGEAKLARAIAEESNPAKKQALEKYRAAGARANIADSLNNMDPDQVDDTGKHFHYFNGALDSKGLRAGFAARAKGQFSKGLIEAEKKVIQSKVDNFFTQWGGLRGDKKFGKISQDIFSIRDLAKQELQDKGLAETNENFANLLESDDFKKTLQQRGLSGKGLNLVTQQFTSAKSAEEKIGAIVAGHDKAKANENVGQNIEKILKILGGEGGQSFTDVLDRLNATISAAMKEGGV